MINTQNHEEKHMPFADKIPIWTPSFLAGYRAFVFGGRDRTYDNTGKVRTASGGIEPFDHLTDQQKKEWNDGVKYAIGEREDCTGLCTPKTMNAAYYKRKEQEFIKMYKKNNRLYNYVYAKALGVSSPFISKCKKKLLKNN
jgi:hypothetical protein